MERVERQKRQLFISGLNPQREIKIFTDEVKIKLSKFLATQTDKFKGESSTF